MGILRKGVAATLLLLTVVSGYPKLPEAIAGQAPITKGKVTEHEPGGRVSEEMSLSEESGAKWLWALLGVALVGGVAAAAGGGGGGGGSDNVAQTGTFTAGW